MSNATGLENVTMFRRLAPERLAEVRAALERRDLPADQLLFSQGDAGDELFVVEEGCVAIFAPSTDQPLEGRPIRLFRAGDVLGEMALIDRQPRSLSARTVEPTRLLVLQGDHFRRLVRDDPEMAFAVISGLNDKMRYTTEFLSQVRHWVERMSAGKYETDEFLRQMQAWVRQVSEGQYDEPSTAVSPGAPAKWAGTKIGYRDETLATLAAEFAKMATTVREREEALKREVAQLRIEIDVAKKQRQVDEIVESDYFKSLKSQAASLRAEREKKRG
jgi:CRP-like cAMP-binding protein